MKKRLLGYYDYTVILTYCGMLFAFRGILQAINTNYWDALLCLMIAGVCDMFDGAVAATKDRNKLEKKFGIQIDSLSDLISFCVLPGVFTYMLFEKTTLASVVAGAYVLCGLIRLAYFNVMEEERQSQTTEKRTTYLGIPVTTIAITLPAVYLLLDYSVIPNKVCVLILMALTAAGFITPIEIKKPKAVGKIVLCVVGFFEALMMILLIGWGAV